ncbi:MAG: proton-conducting transporter membrane subunit [Sedimentisphaerales bacterium]
MLSLFLLLPLLGIIILNLPIKIKMQTAGLLYVLFLSVAQTIVVLFRPENFWSGPDFCGSFLKLKFYTDNLTLVLLLSIGIVVFTAVLVAWQMVSEPRQRLNFINLVLVSMIGMNGTVLLTDIFSLYIFLEITAVSAFILIASQRDIKALEGAFKYIVLSALATVLMLGAIAALLLYSGDTSFASVSEAVKNNNNIIVISAIGLFICGLFIKGGLVPFHGWLPAAYSAAPAAVSVLLAGIITKVAGIYVLLRLVTDVFGPASTINSILLIVGIISILVGALAALWQDDFKKVLAYSSISQIGYIILGLGCGTPLGIAGAVFHLFNHSIFKSLLFVNSAAVEQQIGSTDMNKMGGLGAKMPFSNATSLIATFSAAGIPPAAGFWSKLIIIIALWQTGHHAYASVAIVVGVITLAYLLAIQRKVFFGILPDELKNIKEAGIWIVLPAVVLASIIIGIGVLFPLLFNSFMVPVSSFFK